MNLHQTTHWNLQTDKLPATDFGRLNQYELDVLKVFWRRPPGTTLQVAELREALGYGDTTFHTKFVRAHLRFLWNEGLIEVVDIRTGNPTGWDSEKNPSTSYRLTVFLSDVVRPYLEELLGWYPPNLRDKFLVDARLVFEKSEYKGEQSTGTEARPQTNLEI